MICLHHEDLDGYAAAAVVYRKFGDSVTFFPVNYHKPIPWEAIKEDPEVIIVDFSLECSGDWEKLAEITSQVTWIDHHETAIAKYPKPPFVRFPGLRHTGACGALLAWSYFFPDIRIPPCLILVDAWDRWVHDNNADVLDFKYGMESINWEPMGWIGLLNYDQRRLQEIMHRGEGIRAFDQKQNDRHTFHDLEFEGMRFVAANTQKSGSKLFEGVWDAVTDDSPGRHYDGGICYYWTGEDWVVGIYSPEKRVNHIAVKYGGGGHQRACGFHCKELPWEKSPCSK